MYIEYKTRTDKELIRQRLEAYVNKLNKIEFSGGFKIAELHKSWTENEMQYSMLLKKNFIERRLKGIIKIKEDLIIIEFDLPDIAKNFIRESKLEDLIRMHLEKALQEEALKE